MLEIIERLREGELTQHQLDVLLRSYEKRAHDVSNETLPETRFSRKRGGRRFVKKALLPCYMRIREEEPERWQSWNIDEALESRLIALLRMKPRRTASGVATITVITRPWPCKGDCLYCPSDLRMPKSYLSAEPACQRAERAGFDPYLQVKARLRALVEMGHPTDKIELIVLGGSFTEYPESYQRWFVARLFQALNEGAGVAERPGESVELKETCKAVDPDAESATDEEPVAPRPMSAPCPAPDPVRTKVLQAQVNAGDLTYNEAWPELYPVHIEGEEASEEELADAQRENETALHRVVGLVVETRPDCVDAATLARLRRFGCTKVQIGVQSLYPEVLALNTRKSGVDGHLEDLRRAFALLRLFGFKIHAHYMLNLYGSTSEMDLEGYRRFVEDPDFAPDEVKLYPCVVVESARLAALYRSGEWTPYAPEVLLGVLEECVRATPPFMRISRMIRDISTEDIIAGNKSPNLRQMVEARIAEGVTSGSVRGQSGRGSELGEVGAPSSSTAPIDEIRYREIARDAAELDELNLDEYRYETSVSTEFFLQWLTPERRIAGFLRLSLPKLDKASELLHEEFASLPIEPNQAMIREVHVYGEAVRLGSSGENESESAQHQGLGRRLIMRAAEIARADGRESMLVISSVGTRKYYEALGFEGVETPGGPYQKLEL